MESSRRENQVLLDRLAQLRPKGDDGVEKLREIAKCTAALEQIILINAPSSPIVTKEEVAKEMDKGQTGGWGNKTLKEIEEKLTYYQELLGQMERKKDYLKQLELVNKLELWNWAQQQQHK